MSSAESKFYFDVRIPQLLLDQLSCGQITASMLLAMTFLYRWSDWKTGKVAHASAGGLHTSTANAYSTRTYQFAMERLEKMGWITRHIVPGSRKDFAVTLHNYKWLDEDGKTHILNSKTLTLAVERRRKRRINTGTSGAASTDGCGRMTEPGSTNAVAPTNSAAQRTAVEVTFKEHHGNDGEDGSSHGSKIDPCGRNCTEVSHKILSSPSLKSSYPAQAPDLETNTGPQQENLASDYQDCAALEPTELPENFRPDANNVKFAKKNGLNLEEEITLFHELHGALGNERKNWQSVFRKHLETAAPLRGRVAVPDWMPAVEWDAYLKMRDRINRGATQAAQSLIVQALDKLRSAGHSPATVLNASTRNEWTDVNRYH